MTDISLAGPWTLRDAKGRAIGPCPIPGDIHSALVVAGRIPDPLVAMNEADVQWVGEATWEIQRTVVLPASALAGKWAVLDLEFVDTVADVIVNGVKIARLASCFIRHRLDVTKALRRGKNTIVLRFHSAAAEAKRLAAIQPFPIPWSVSNNRIADMNMIRKAQCHAGWDWGPCIMAMGVYAEPKLRLFDAARIEHMVVRQKHHDSGRVSVTADVELAACRDGMVPVSFAFAGKVARGEVAVSAAGGGKIALSIDVDQPKLWWPAGYGAQPLHEAVVEIPGDRVEKKIGLRKLELVNEPDAIGASMIFRVNGVDIFAKGANWVPADALPARMTGERIARLLGEAVAANMNMIRVWGGGFYELDVFYDLCDELGLLVWQDMMFSCSQYPSTPAFLAEADGEIRYQVKRLASHASIALWCGDNEVIGSLTWYDLSKKNRDRYLVNYDRLNRVIEIAVTESDPDRPFWPSSPCSGKLDYGDAWHKDGAGDMHFWSVWHENKDFEHYYDVRPRFCSEFGFQSFPTMTVVRRFALPSEWNATSPVMEFHQRDKAGNGRIVETMTRYFRIPTSFESFLYLSQLQQALAIETAVRYWRSLKPHSMGTLYWQLNDVWPSVSWSSLDHALAWKTLHYHARRFFAPVALAARIVGGKLIVSGMNDTRQPKKIDGRIRRLAFDGRVLDERRMAATVPTDRAIEISQAAVPEGRDFFYLIEAREKGGAEFDPMLRLVILPGKPKSYDLPAATVTMEAVTGRPGVFALSADQPAFFVRPEAPDFDGAFDDASFALLPGETRTIAFRSYDGRMPGVADITVDHLATTYAVRAPAVRRRAKGAAKIPA
jgi:beta-mannosidase